MGKIQHSTFNIQRPTAEPASEPAKTLDVGCSDWLLLNSGPGSAAFNMALDEALLETAPQFGKPLLRFYGWEESAASFGYFQKYSDVERMTFLRPLVRRPTGGGLVPHDADWTYSLVFPSRNSWYALKAAESYRRVHEWIQAAFTKVGIATELAECCRKALPGQCFVGHEKFDLLWQGQKIAGAAQRRTRHGLLIQGSVQPPAGLARADWERAIVAVAERHPNWRSLELDAQLRARAEELAATKYGLVTYNQRR